MSRLALVSALVASIAGLSCGDDGNKCTNPNGCEVRAQTRVKWQFNHYPELSFEDDSCNEVGAETVEVTVTKTDDATVTMTQTPKCNDKEVTFLDLPPGTFDVTVRPLDIDGNALVSAPATGTVPSGSVDVETKVEINVPYTLWTHAYTGSFLFNLRWGGMPCATATPPVAQQTLTMTLRGQPVTATTDAGQKLDGSAPHACTMFDFVTGLPFGPATLDVIGKDAGGTVRFQKHYDTFVGVGTFNPTLTFDQPLPDAAIDAPPDVAIDAPPDTM